VTASEPRTDDDTLVSLAGRGDPDALAHLVQRHQGVVYRYLLSRTGDEDRAADLTQDTFLKALRSLAQYRGEASFRTWLLAIARNEMLGQHRKAERRGEQELDKMAEMPDDSASPAETALLGSEMDRARKLLERLPEKQRMSVWLRLDDGLSFREVAEATDSTEGAARVNYFHGIRKLREWANEDE
jgi:RNA polymerase sigma factor (sigma-70 family)